MKRKGENGKMRDTEIEERETGECREREGERKRRRRKEKKRRELKAAKVSR